MVKNMSGIVFNGLYLVQKEPSKGDKGLLVNGKYFIPVTNEPSGAVASYYKCTAVSSGAAQPEGYVLTIDFYDSSVPGDPLHYKNTLTMVDPSATGLDRVWKSADGAWELKKYDMSQYEGYISWQLYMSSEGITYVVHIDDIGPNTITGDNGVIIDNNEPWTITRWSDTYGGYTDTITWTASPAVSGERTWSGYKAVFDSTAGTWSFESGVTEGLTYTSVTPSVGGIYSADALVTVSMLYDGTVTLPGCVFYAELKDNTSELKSGQTLTIPSSAMFQTIGGVQCVQLNGSDKITFTAVNLPAGNTARTYCFWNYLTETPSGGTLFGSKPSSYISDAYYQIEWYNNGYNWSFGGNSPFSNATAPLNRWNFVAVTYNGNGVYYLYVNKTKYNPSNSNTLNTKLDVNYIGPLAGYYAKARIFDYCLSESEIGTMVDNGL